MVTSQITPGAFVRLSSFSVPPEEKVATAMLIDHGKRVVTGAAEVAVIGLALSCWPWVGLSELSMSRTMPSGGLRSCTQSIQSPGMSISDARLASVASHSVSKRPMAAARSQAIQPLTTNHRPHCGITGQPLGVVDVLVAR